MRVTLEDMQPKLVVKAEEVGKETVIVEKEAAEASVIAEAVGKDEAVAQKQADAANAIAEECKEALEEAMPALRAAEEALKNIGQKDITMIKTVNIPTPPVRMVMSAVCLLMHVEPIKKMNPETQKRETDFWPPAQKMMASSDFLKSMVGYDKEAIDEKLIKALKPFVEQPNFTKEALMPVSSVAANIGSWVLAMFKFYHVNLIVIPKKA
jgi:dynein heavy chain